MHPALKQCKFEQDGSNHCISFWVWKKTKSSMTSNLILGNISMLSNLKI